MPDAVRLAGTKAVEAASLVIWRRGRAYSAFFAKTTDGIREAGSFSEPKQWRFDWERSYTRDEWLDGVPTAGGFSLRSAEEMKELLEGIGDAIDSVGGTFTMGYATVVVSAARSDAD